MKVRSFNADVFNGDLEDQFNNFFSSVDLTDASRLSLGSSSVTLQKGQAFFLLGGRNSIVRELRAAGTNHFRTDDGSCLSISFKANITRKAEFVKTAAKEVKAAVSIPLAAVVTPIVLYNRTGDKDVVTNAKLGAKSVVHSIEAAERMQEYNRKTCIIVQVFNSDTDGEPAPANDYGLINHEVTFTTMATLLDQLFATSGASS